MAPLLSFIPVSGKHSGLVKAIIFIFNKCFPTFAFHSIALVKNYASKAHIDAGDLGPSCSMTVGSFTGGELAGEGCRPQKRHQDKIK